MTQNDNSAKIWIDKSTYIDLKTLPAWWVYIGLGLSMWMQNLIIIGTAAIYWFPELVHQTSKPEISVLALRMYSMIEANAPGTWLIRASDVLHLVWFVPVIIGVYVGAKTNWGRS